MSTYNDKSGALAVMLGWMVPGLGHWYLGRRGKAALFFVCIIGLYLTGFGLGSWRIARIEDTLLFLVQALSGAVAFVTAMVTNSLRQQPISNLEVPVRFEMGNLYTLVAGFLNLLVMMDAFMVAHNIDRPARLREEERARAAAAGAADDDSADEAAGTAEAREPGETRE